MLWIDNEQVRTLQNNQRCVVSLITWPHNLRVVCIVLQLELHAIKWKAVVCHFMSSCSSNMVLLVLLTLIEGSVHSTKWFVGQVMPLTSLYIAGILDLNKTVWRRLRYQSESCETYLLCVAYWSFIHSRQLMSNFCLDFITTVHIFLITVYIFCGSIMSLNLCLIRLDSKLT